ncbi:MAG: hypothetical protein JO275_05210, partial [Verrucomicrobia bacterium]|nr:hypothetical protein [Verrucomicrobiota bacterium]
SALETQRSELETQLKKAEEKLQATQQNADLAASQRSALEAQLKKAQAENLQLAQQNTDLANSQRSELETQLKKEQEKLQQVQANADRLASELTESQAQLRQEQERVQKAQANIDSPNSELRGVSVNTSVTSPITGMNPEEKRDELHLGEYARFNPPQDVAPTPLPPSNKESETSNPPKSQFGRNAEASGEMASLKEFVLGYLRTVAINDTSTQRQYFAERVNFYGRGVLDSSNVEASTQRYHDEWPIRKWTPRGEAKVVHSRKHNGFVVYQPFSWAVSADSQHADGDATLYLRIRKNSLGEFRIVHVQQLGR